jgi:hypothetical protein
MKIHLSFLAVLHGRHFFAAVCRRQSFTFLHQFSVQIEKFSIAN